MAIKTGDVVNMEAFLGIGIQVYLKDGTAFNFKPVGFIKDTYKRGRDFDCWSGADDEGGNRIIIRMDIDFIKYH